MNSGIDSISPLVVSPGSPPARHGTRSLQRLFYYAQGEVRDVDGIQEFCMLHGALQDEKFSLRGNESKVFFGNCSSASP